MRVHIFFKSRIFIALALFFLLERVEFKRAGLTTVQMVRGSQIRIRYEIKPSLRFMFLMSNSISIIWYRKMLKTSKLKLSVNSFSSQNFRSHHQSGIHGPILFKRDLWATLMNPLRRCQQDCSWRPIKHLLVQWWFYYQNIFETMDDWFYSPRNHTNRTK